MNHERGFFGEEIKNCETKDTVNVLMAKEFKAFQQKSLEHNGEGGERQEKGVDTYKDKIK